MAQFCQLSSSLPLFFRRNLCQDRSCFHRWCRRPCGRANGRVGDERAGSTYVRDAGVGRHSSLASPLSLFLSLSLCPRQSSSFPSLHRPFYDLGGVVVPPSSVPSFLPSVSSEWDRKSRLSEGARGAARTGHICQSDRVGLHAAKANHFQLLRYAVSSPVVQKMPQVRRNYLGHFLSNWTSRRYSV